ncbi:hypothetical protein BATDEDRAFT_89240 [Batrachochytrium dendrobatidis JAM81]|uniref:Uncharacterized protein n=1 Tax=Batrachochytrium dendrobatidis (strain JAM81 / FGSC 10211) TaxID=684364 RepID=F4P576_BATDJ|nr:uncharacterized protein BATDEDRAFT_89240 [Batrachochytrium dendrobatidis JAM81]EGF80049.1 hypothetical protein BATDEDRAFT_89240 [Batrachochytrium dendrobatidis JAM81]|eukprot:XP_006679764.1 hypothetical protein BATDEDRAFT_89240 [Batrachochytrium dendrobatidis JAM81]
MKLAVAVLSSILLACSVTIANPIKPSESTDVETSTSTVIPSATTSTEASTSPTPNPNGIGLGGLDALPDSIKELLEKYVRLGYGRDEQKKVCDPLKSEHDSQIMLVAGLETKIQVLERKFQRSGGSPKYDGKIQKTKVDLEAQESKLKDIRSRYKECQLKKSCFENTIYFTKLSLVNLIFGRNWNCESLYQQFDLIKKHSSVKGYLDELSLEYSKILGQSPSDQQCQESQPSPDTPSGSGSSGQKVPSNKRKRVSKLMHDVGSCFHQPKDDNPSN